MLDSCTSNGHPDLAEPLSVGNVVYRNRVLLAPLSGITDVAFRRLAWNAGAGMVVSEMVASEAFVTGQDEMRLKAEGASLPVHVVQLAGREPQWMVDAARMAEQAGADVIDINMGCPARKVVTGQSGSALMRDLDLATQLVAATVEAVDLPVTVKMRLGWDENTLNAPELAERAEGEGAALLTVHGRTRNQFYKGRADWARVADVRVATALPLVVNGDIGCREDAETAMRLSGADAVMVGRAACGRPWLPAAIASGRDERPDDLAQYVLDHLRTMRRRYGDRLGVRMGRKHAQWYAQCAGLPDRSVLPRLLRADDPSEVDDLVCELFGCAQAQAA